MVRTINKFELIGKYTTNTDKIFATNAVLWLTITYWCIKILGRNAVDDLIKTAYLHNGNFTTSFISIRN